MDTNWNNAVRVTADSHPELYSALCDAALESEIGEISPFWIVPQPWANDMSNIPAIVAGFEMGWEVE
jgi:hypothetical protein